MCVCLCLSGRWEGGVGGEGEKGGVEGLKQQQNLP